MWILPLQECVAVSPVRPFVCLVYTVKISVYPRYFVATLPYFNGTEFFVDRRIQTCTEAVPLKYGKLATKHPWIYGYFYSVDGTR